MQSICRFIEYVKLINSNNPSIFTVIAYMQYMTYAQLLYFICLNFVYSSTKSLQRMRMWLQSMRAWPQCISIDILKRGAHTFA